ncbi:Asp/Glu/hydantoin racemase [Sphaerotilaceae bacterium SBD11-9]
MNDIAFLHTAPAHVATFGALMRELAPELRVTHLVREDLLADAQAQGVGDPALAARVRAALGEGRARVVACTCSTLGGIAEATDTGGAFEVMRIDRAMADQAVRGGGVLRVVASVQSTLAPTAALLQSSAQRLGASITIEPMLVAEAWAHFLAGRQAGYIDSIVSAVLAAPRGPTVVLAQASMAPAAAVLAAQGIEALTSPRLGVEHAIALCAAR